MCHVLIAARLASQDMWPEILLWPKQHPGCAWDGSIVPNPVAKNRSNVSSLARNHIFRRSGSHQCQATPPVRKLPLGLEAGCAAGTRPHRLACRSRRGYSAGTKSPGTPKMVPSLRMRHQGWRWPPLAGCTHGRPLHIFARTAPGSCHGIRIQAPIWHQAA